MDHIRFDYDKKNEVLEALKNLQNKIITVYHNSYFLNLTNKLICLGKGKF